MRQQYTNNILILINIDQVPCVQVSLRSRLVSQRLAIGYGLSVEQSHRSLYATMVSTAQCLWPAYALCR